LLCKEGFCYQHSLKAIDPKITDYKTVSKLAKPTKPILKMADLMNQKDKSNAELMNLNVNQKKQKGFA